MIRLIAVAFALALATSVQAMPPVPAQQSDQMVTQVREACGAGMRRTAAGVCVRTRSHYRGAYVGVGPARRAVRRCAAGVTC
jgi:hypothetical protein